MKLIVPPFIQKCKHVITCSNASKKDIIKTMGIPPEKISVIYWGVKHDIFYPQVNKIRVKQELQSKFNIANPFFLSVSCNTERKRTDVLVNSYLTLLKDKQISHDLVLVWRNPPQTLLDEIKRSGFQTRIHF